jgi:hypothetical protein
MNLVTATVTLADRLDGPPAQLDGHVVVDILWAAARPAHRIEHISVFTGPACLHIGISLIAADRRNAERVAHDLLDRARQASALFGSAVSAIRINPN